MAYIYRIRNDVNGKCYIGCTRRSIIKRFQEHLNEARLYEHNDKLLYQDIRKYGAEHFHVSLVEETDNPDEREAFWIQHDDTCDSGYNSALGGKGRRACDYGRIVSLWEDGNVIKDIHKMTGYDVQVISKVLKKNGVSAEEISSRATKHRSHPVQQVDLRTGEVIETFPSACAAARSLGSDSKHYHIMQACKQIARQAYGYGWKFAV